MNLASNDLKTPVCGQHTDIVPCFFFACHLTKKGRDLSVPQFSRQLSIPSTSHTVDVLLRAQGSAGLSAKLLDEWFSGTLQL